jgi:hypothetical protein
VAQQQVRAAFLNPARLRDRVQPVLQAVRRNIHDLHAAVASNDRAEFCRMLSFALWNICDALLGSVP